jgi:hypothetical protein
VATLTGRCLCGEVRFEVAQPFTGGAFCHCLSCKKLSGGGGTANGRVPTEAIRVVAGEELLRTYQPDEGSAKTFCSACGSNLFGGGWPDSPAASVRLSALDDPGGFVPGSHIFVRSVAPWETLSDDGLPRFDIRDA